MLHLGPAEFILATRVTAPFCAARIRRINANTGRSPTWTEATWRNKFVETANDGLSGGQKGIWAKYNTCFLEKSLSKRIFEPTLDRQADIDLGSDPVFQLGQSTLAG